MEGLHLATAGDDVKFWDCSNGFALFHSFNPHANHAIASLAWNHEGSLLASCSPDDDQVVVTYMKSAAFTPIQLQCGTGIGCTGFGSRYLLCGGEKGVSVWDLKTKAVLKSYQGHKGPVTSVSFNFNSSYVASGAETGEIILYNMLTCKASSPMTASGVQAIRQLEYSAFKKSMFGTASDDGAITLWDANTRRAVHRFKDAHVGPATGLAFSPLNEMLMMSVGLDKRVVAYDIHKKQVLKVMEAQSPLTCIDIMPDGATAVVGSTRGKVYIYDLRQGGNVPTHSFQAHKTSVRSVKFMPSAKLKTEDPGGVKGGVSTSAGNRRQLPPAPTVMQDITPSKTGQTPDTDQSLHAVSPMHQATSFSELQQGNQSQSHHSKSQSHLDLTGSHGESAFGGVFSLLKDEGDVSALSTKGDCSLYSLPSFLGQNKSHSDSQLVGGHASFILGSGGAGPALSPPHGPQHSNSHLFSPAPAPHHHHPPASSSGHQHLMGSPSPLATEDLRGGPAMGHLSHLQISGTVQSPSGNRLSHPKLSSSLQSPERAVAPAPDGTSHPHSPSLHPHSPSLHPHSPSLHPHSPSLHPHSPSLHPHSPSLHPHSPSLHPHSPSLHPHSPGSTQGWSGAGQQVCPPGQEAGQSMLNGLSGLRLSPRDNRSAASVSPDSAALSGGEDSLFAGGLSPGRSAASHYQKPVANNNSNNNIIINTNRATTASTSNVIPTHASTTAVPNNSVGTNRTTHGVTFADPGVADHASHGVTNHASHGVANPRVMTNPGVGDFGSHSAGGGAGGCGGGGATAAGPVDVVGAGAGAVQRSFLRSLVADAMEDVRDDLHRDIQGLHVAMLRQFHSLERDMQSNLSHYSDMNQKLMLYIRQLEEENRQLKKNY